MARRKLGPGGTQYEDPNDTGPDQWLPSPMTSPMQTQAPSDAVGPFGNVTQDWPTQMPQASQQAQPFNREQFRDAWMGTGSDAGAQNALLQQYGLSLDPAGRSRLPTGEVLDLRIGAKAGGTQASWGGTGQDLKIGQSPSAGGGGGMAPGAAGATGAPAAGSFQDSIRQILLQQLGEMGKPVTENDPAIAGELQSAERGAERTRQDRRAMMAERFAQQGLNSGGAGSGAFDSELIAGQEDKGNTLQGVRAQLFGRELTQRRTQMAQLLNMALQTGDAESARALQLQIAQMDNELGRLGINTSAGIAGARLGEESRQFDDEFGWMQKVYEDQQAQAPWLDLF